MPMTATRSTFELARAIQHTIGPFMAAAFLREHGFSLDESLWVLLGTTSVAHTYH